MGSTGFMTSMALFVLSISIFLIFSLRRLPLKIFLRKFFFSVLAATILGGLGLAAGVIGPLVFDPEHPEAPILGLVITGPLGFLLGMVLGWVLPRQRAAAAK